MQGQLCWVNYAVIIMQKMIIPGVTQYYFINDAKLISIYNFSITKKNYGITAAKLVELCLCFKILEVSKCLC